MGVTSDLIRPSRLNVAHVHAISVSFNSIRIVSPILHFSTVVASESLEMLLISRGDDR